MSLDDTDKSFIIATYSDPEWSTGAIAETLEVSVSQVHRYAAYMGIKRPSPNWRKIWHTVKSGSSLRKTASTLGCSRTAVSHAMTRMRVMTPQEREALWQKRGFK